MQAIGMIAALPTVYGAPVFTVYWYGWAPSSSLQSVYNRQNVN